MHAVPIDREALINTLVAGLAADFRQHLLPSAAQPAAPADQQPTDAADPGRLDDAIRILETLTVHFDDSPELATLLRCARRLRDDALAGSGAKGARRFHDTEAREHQAIAIVHQADCSVGGDDFASPLLLLTPCTSRG